jgi:ethanolaminephosphotransferase
MDLSPNVITVTGFLLNILSHLVLLSYQGLSLEGRLPTWVPIMVAINWFIYVFLDNADGKQARRTHSSSVLGMLIDHGSDGYVSILIGLNLLMILQAGCHKATLLGCLISTVPFYFATLESYFIGGVNLPEINAVSDGCFAIMGICFSAAYVGSDYLINTTVLNGLRISHSLSYVFIPTAIIITFQNIY